MAAMGGELLATRADEPAFWDVKAQVPEAQYYTDARESPGHGGFWLLLTAMEKLNLAAIAKLTLNQREQIVLMRPYHGGIVLHTLYFPAEVREVAEYGKAENMTLQKPEIDLAEQFIRQLTAHFHP